MALVEQLQLSISEDLPTHLWLKTQFSALLEHHMAYKCSNLKHGTILYRYGGDIFRALSTSLWQEQKNSDTNIDKTTTKEICLLLNTKLHNQANKLIEQDFSSPHRIEDFDTDSFISSIDKDVWEAICTLTQTVKASSPTHTGKLGEFSLPVSCSLPLISSVHSLCTHSSRTLLRLAEVLVTCIWY